METPASSGIKAQPGRQATQAQVSLRVCVCVTSTGSDRSPRSPAQMQKASLEPGAQHAPSMEQLGSQWVSSPHYSARLHLSSCLPLNWQTAICPGNF